MINHLPIILVARRLLRAKVSKIHYKPKIVRDVAIINEDDRSLKHTNKMRHLVLLLVLVSVWIRVVIN